MSPSIRGMLALLTEEFGYANDHESRPGGWLHWRNRYWDVRVCARAVLLSAHLRITNRHLQVTKRHRQVTKRQLRITNRRRRATATVIGHQTVVHQATRFRAETAHRIKAALVGGGILSTAVHPITRYRAASVGLTGDRVAQAMAAADGTAVHPATQYRVEIARPTAVHVIRAIRAISVNAIEAVQVGRPHSLVFLAPAASPRWPRSAMRPGLAADPIGLSCPLLLLLSPKAAYLGVRQWNGSSGKHRLRDMKFPTG
jgi:hypothetical protein